MAPMKVESMDHFRVSKNVIPAHVRAPADAHRFVTHSAITDWKLKASVVPASKASQEPQIMMRARSWKNELPGRWRRMWVGVRFSEPLDLKMGYERYRLIADAVAPEQMWTGVPAGVG